MHIHIRCKWKDIRGKVQTVSFFQSSGQTWTNQIIGIIREFEISWTIQSWNWSPTWMFSRLFPSLHYTCTHNKHRYQTDCSQLGIVLSESLWSQVYWLWWILVMMYTVSELMVDVNLRKVKENLQWFLWCNLKDLFHIILSLIKCNN